ncbi:MAG: 3-keto-disaccharide hydrolase [Coraliomargaritaceae bacterium]
MRPLRISFFLLSCIAPFLDAEETGFYQFKVWGHDKNPLLPGSKWKIHDNARPDPPRVIPGAYKESSVPLGAEILFDGTSLDPFLENDWKLKDGTVVAGKGGLVTKKAYGDCQLHIEWRTPDPSVAEKNARMGNSGIYFMGRYELQIFDSFSCEIYPDGSAGAIYGLVPPLVNASRKPGEWQTFDIFFTAPVFEGEKLVKKARMSVLHNGVFVQVGTELRGPTSHNKPKYYTAHKGRLPFTLQGGKSPVAFRNIWIIDRSLDD